MMILVGILPRDSAEVGQPDCGPGLPPPMGSQPQHQRGDRDDQFS
jgi:hypothetical protein